MITVNPNEIKHHKIASLHREQTDEEYESLKLSIEEIGQLEPVKLYRDLLVDGRHRQKALIELGIDTMKAEVLPRNYSKKQLEEAVIGSEMRRADNGSQKAIRAYMWLKKQEKKITQVDAAIKFGCNQADVSRAKNIEQKVGIDNLKKFYEKGYIYFNNHKITNLIEWKKELKRIEENIDRDDSLPSKEPNEAVKNMYQTLSSFAASGDLSSLGKIKEYTTALIHDLNIKM